MISEAYKEAQEQFNQGLIKIENGRVLRTGTKKRSYKEPRIIDNHISLLGYRTFSIRYNKTKTCSIVSHKFIWLAHNNFSMPNGYVVDHIDGNKLNNSPDNLEAISPSSNAKRKYKM